MTHAELANGSLPLAGALLSVDWELLELHNPTTLAGYLASDAERARIRSRVARSALKVEAGDWCFALMV